MSTADILPNIQSINYWHAGKFLMMPLQVPMYLCRYGSLWPLLYVLDLTDNKLQNRHICIKLENYSISLLFITVIT